MKENSSAEEHWEVWKTAFEVFAWVKQFKCLKDDQNLCNKDKISRKLAVQLMGSIILITEYHLEK